jgi:hypothetical protein
MSEWIQSSQQFKDLQKRAGDCKLIDSRRRVRPDLVCLVFDDADLRTKDFVRALNTLLRLGDDVSCTYLVLDPDPLNYFQRHFGKYSALRFESPIVPEDFLARLSEDPGDSPADALGVNWWECVIIPSSSPWFIHCLRDTFDQGGHLWIPCAWETELVRTYSFLKPSSTGGMPSPSSCGPRIVGG